ncbi:uncharacterized protein LOC106062434 [Biomphalaria glabrata]|uniref:Uncharacterized protein LOC106062434 n=1 Tax=Biomphalaria glabrata TaxID=6526 RepID=A0A9U8E7U7_BIOGL|nr:uncharacterized protein LOC106062434 [Biomphalaria glabrata]KAI8754495.1 hypothetical protein BgiMline_012961 [Biomphalaria glabrata]
MIKTTEELARELKSSLNMTAQEYFQMLTRNLSSFKWRSVALDTSEGLLWVILTPLVYFVLVGALMTALLVYYWHAEGRADVPAASCASAANGQATTELNLPTELARTFLNIDGASQVLTRSSSMSKGSVRSLGTLTDLDLSVTTPRSFNNVVKSASSAVLHWSRKNEIEMGVISGSDGRPERLTGDGKQAAEKFPADPGSCRSSNVSDFHMNYPPLAANEVYKLVWVSGDEVQSDFALDTCNSLTSSGSRPFNPVGSTGTHKQTTTRDLNRSKHVREKPSRKMFLREHLLKYGARLNKTSCNADSLATMTREDQAQRHYTDPPVRRHESDLISPRAISDGSYLEYAHCSDPDVLKLGQPYDTANDEIIQNGRRLFSRHLELDHEAYTNDDLYSSGKGSSNDFSCGPVDMSDYQDLDYFDTCEDQLYAEESDWTASSVGHQSSLSEDFGADDSSEQSPALSLPSSIYRFHASKKGVQSTPQAHYPFTDTQSVASFAGRSVCSNEMEEASLYPNAGSGSQTGTTQTSKVNSMADSSFGNNTHSAEIKLHKEEPKQSFQNISLHNPCFQHSYFQKSKLIKTTVLKSDLEQANDKSHLTFSEPEGACSIKRKGERKKKHNRFSLDILKCGRVTVEERLQEFGFLKAKGRKYFINPSPSRFSRRGLNGCRSSDCFDNSKDPEPGLPSDEESLTHRQQEEKHVEGCSDSFCYGSYGSKTSGLMDVDKLKDNMLRVMKRDEGGDNNNNNITYIRGTAVEGSDHKYHVSGDFRASKKIFGERLSLTQHKCSVLVNHSVSVELSTEGHLIESSTNDTDYFQGHDRHTFDVDHSKGNIDLSTKDSLHDIYVWQDENGPAMSTTTRPVVSSMSSQRCTIDKDSVQLLSRTSDVIKPKCIGHQFAIDRNRTHVVSRMSDEVNTTAKLRQFCLNRMSTLDLIRLTGGLSADSDSQGSDFFSKQHPSLMTPPTPDTNDEHMFTISSHHKYTSTPLYRQ